MAATPSTMPPLGMPAPDFRLPDTGGVIRTLPDFAGASGLLVAFICPHCPFVVHIRHELGAFGRSYQDKGLAIVAIMSNDLAQYPQDDLEGMCKEAEEGEYSFAYLLDESQEAASSVGRTRVHDSERRSDDDKSGCCDA